MNLTRGHMVVTVHIPSTILTVLVKMIKLNEIDKYYDRIGKEI